MRKWPFILKIWGFITLCLFTFEYLHPSAVGVRAYNSKPPNYYISYKSACLQQGKPQLIVNADYNHFPKIPLTHSNETGLKKNVTIYAMIMEFIPSIDWTFPGHKFQPVKKFIQKQLNVKEIYHPPRLSFII